MMDTKQKFKVYCSTNINDTVNKSLITEFVEEEKPLVLEAIISTNSVDLDGDYMTNECLEDMKKQVIGLNIFLDHEHTIDKIVGSITELIETSSDVIKVKYQVLPKYEWYLLELLENGVNLGMSIGASVLDFEDTDNGWKINKVKLVEVSIVGIPANWDTFGSVEISKGSEDVITANCFNGACKQIIDLNLQKNMVKKDFEDGEDIDEDQIITEQEVVNLINEAMIVLKDQIITEIVSEYNLDGKKHTPSEDADSDESTNSSNDNGDKEKSIDMEKDEIIELIKEHSLTEDVVKEVIMETLKEFKEIESEAEVTEETPIVKEEEVDVTKAKEEDAETSEEEIEKEVEVETETEEIEIEKEVEVETETEEEVEVEKSSEEKVDVGVTIETFDMEELKKSLKEELRAEVEAEVEAELLKTLSVERKPTETKQPKVEEVEKDFEDNVEKSKGNVMSAREMAEHLIRL